MYFNKSFLYVLIFLLSQFSLASMATGVSLEGLMQDDSKATKQQTTKSSSSGTSLGDLMGTPKPKKASSSSSKGSLLGDVEGERSSRKKKGALDEYQKARNDLSAFCGCLNTGDCERQWSSKSWNRSSRYLTDVNRATRDINKVCSNAPRDSLTRSSSLEDIQKHAALASGSRNKLQQIKRRMKSAASSDRLDQYYQAKKDKKSRVKAVADAKRRKFNQETARMNADVDRAWKRDANKRDDSWDKIKQIERQTMNDINAHQKRTQQPQKQKRQQSNHNSTADKYELIARACANNGGRYNRATDRCESKQPKKQTASVNWEKKNCIAAGKKWRNGSCDYSSSVKIQGWSKTGTAPGASNSSRGNQSGSSARGSHASSNGHNNSAGAQNRSGNSQSGWNSSNSGSSSQKKASSRLVFFAVREESKFSWSTQEKACKHAKAKAIRVAEKRCKNDHNGVTATTRDIPIPVDANCQSYRQMTKTGLSGTKGEWKVTGNVSFYCRLAK